jgi:hypothetical protein
VLRVPYGKWTDDDIAKLKNLAGKVPARDIAAELGRTLGSLAVQASKLKIPLRRNRYSRGTAPEKPSRPAPTNR